MQRTKTSLLIVVLTVAGSLAAAQTSNAASSTFKKTFSASLSGVSGPPYTLAANSTYSLTLTLTNTTKGPQAFGSAQITVPTGLTVTSANANAPGATATFAAQRLSDTIVLITSTGPTGSGVLSGGSLTLTLGISTGTSACPPAWGIQVKQSNDFSGSGNDFVTTDVISTPIGAGSLAWTTQPSTTQYNAAMGSIAGAAPVVTATGPCGESVTAPAIQLTDSAALLTSSGPSTNGSAVTFTNVQFSTFLDGTDSLIATAPGFTQATSNQFAVEEKLGVCTAASCLPLHISGTQTGLDLSLTYDGTPRIDTASHHTPEALCAGESSIVGSSVSETFKVFSNSSNGKHVTFTVSKTLVNAISNNGAPFMSVCYVPIVNGVDQTGYTLPDCTTASGAFLSNPPCVVSRGKNAANEVIVVSLPPGDPKLNVA